MRFKFIIKIFYFIISIIDLNLNGFSQSLSFAYKTVPSYFTNSNSNSNYNRYFLNTNNGADNINNYNIETCLPVGYVKDGSIDYTPYIQKAIDNHKEIVFPDFPLLIDVKGLSLRSNSILIFKKGSKLIMETNGRQSYAVLKLYNVKNIIIYYPTIVGDRIKHLAKDGEWGMGISIRGSNNVDIINPNISRCWGDGIYMGSYRDVYNKNIHIYNGIIDFNRRNGISIVSGDSIMISKTVISNTYGHAPMSGVDIEPDNNNDVVNNIIIDSVITFNNGERGLLINLNRLVGSKDKEVNISIVNHHDYGSPTALLMAVNKIEEGQPLNGFINIINPTWAYNGKEVFRYYNGKENDLYINFKNIKVIEKGNMGNDVLNMESLSNIKSILKRYSKVIISN